MSMLEVFKNHEPKENPEFGQKKKLVGDCVAQIQSLEKIVAKSGAEWIVLKTNAINVIEDPKGREVTIMPGDEISNVYNPNDVDSLKDLDNDLFTAGIEFSRDAESDEQLLKNMHDAAKEKLVYWRCWAKDKPESKREPGKPNFYQNQVIKSKNLITPENSVAQLPF